MSTSSLSRFPSTSTSPQVDTSLASADGKRRPDCLELSPTKSQPSARGISNLANARMIEDIGSIQYPEGVKCPKPGLNVNAKQGHFRYDRDFLLQFVAVCTGKPNSMAPLDALGLEPVDQSLRSTRGGSHGRRSSSNTMPPPSRQASIGRGISGLNKLSVNSSKTGQPPTPSQKMTGDDRSAASTRAASMSGSSKRGKRGGYSQAGPTPRALAGGPAARPSPKVGDLEKEEFIRQLSMFRGGSGPGGERGDHTQIGPDGLAVAGGAATRPASKAGDLSKFGKIDKSTLMTFRPSSVFRKGNESKSNESTIRRGSTNMFSMPYSNPRLTTSEAAGKSNRASHCIDSDEGNEKLSGSGLMSEAEARARIEQDVIEFFAVRDLGEAETYFAYLPSRYKHLLVDRLVMRAVESKAADTQLVADLFERAVARKLCTPAAFEEGFAPTAEIIDDIAIDAPKALELFAIMIKGAGLHMDVERRT